MKAYSMTTLDKARDQTKQNLDFINEGECSNPGYDSSKAPFFNQEPCENDSNGIAFDSQRVNKFLDYIPVPPNLSELFKIIGTTDVEFYWDKWTLFSMDKIAERFEIYKKNGQLRVIDFAQAYLGMGHVIVAAIDPKELTIFFRRDGGSNGWDREINWTNIKNYTPEPSDTHNFSVWLELVKSKTKIWDIAHTMCIK